ARSGIPLASDDVSKPANVVYLARYISESHQKGLTVEDILRVFPFNVAEKLGLSEQFISEKLPEILALESGLGGLVD
ncbi:MAG: HDOD domain-containing protein, partial [Methylococcaceae bacterium]|nr:HDOD domain-containing protein [Methylococcaceae bacterium]